MRGDVVLVLGHMYNRLLTYRTGIMVYRSQINGVSSAETLAKFLKSFFAENAAPNEATNTLLRATNTSCQTLGHKPEAVCQARKCYFLMVDHFGLNSLFLTVTSDDLWSF